jgi:hypothetical protein
MFNKCFFEDRAVYEIMWKYIVEPGRSQMTIWCMRIACWIPYKHTLITCNIYCFSTVAVFARKRHNITIYVHCLACWKRVTFWLSALSARLVATEKNTAIYISSLNGLLKV